MDVSITKKCITDIKDLDQWFCYTNTRCNSLDTHMQYMKMLWNERQPESPELKKSVDSLDYHNFKTKVSDSVKAKTPTEINYNNSLKECPNHQFASVNNNDDTKACNSRNPRANTENVLPKIGAQQREEETIKNLDVQKETKAELTTITPRTYSLPQSARISLRPLSSPHKESKYKEYNDNWQYPSWNHLTKYSQGLIQDAVNSKKSFEQLIMENQNDILLQELSSVRADIKLNSSGNAKTGALGKSKIRVKNDKKEKIISSTLSSKKGSLCKLDDITSLKFKKRRRKLHSSNSKSTVATRDTNFVGRKDIKKRKQKNTANNRHILNSHQTSNEVVEIYHNAATKSGSTAVISSKHPKLDCHTNYINKLSPATNKQQTVHAKSKCENNYQHNTNIDESNRQECSEKQCQPKEKTEGKSMNTHDKNCNLEIATTPVYTVEKFNSHGHQQSIMQASYCDPMITRSYEMPTLASKLKRVNRSYFSRFNFRNIPFVVGTSVTPSHNLGLNIQQVLSIMKTRQPAVNGVTPLLIRKVSKGMKPVSILMEQINDRCTKLPYMNSEMIATSIEQEHSFMNDPDNLCKSKDAALQYGNKRFGACTLNLKLSAKQYENLQETVKTDTYENCHKKNTRSENQLNRCNTAQISKNPGNVKLLKLFSSQQNVKTQMETLDVRSKNYQGSVCDMDTHDTRSVNQSQSSKGIKEVLVNLHDQFEEMNTKYEKLQSKVEKSDDKKLEEEVTTLEKELNAKEDEINAVVNLYKEVMALKQQMRLLQEKNSYVCISTEVPFGPNKTCSSGPLMLTKSYGKNLQQKVQHRKGAMVPPREPTSLRLAGLLRQIQVFQKQLSSR